MLGKKSRNIKKEYKYKNMVAKNRGEGLLFAMIILGVVKARRLSFPLRRKSKPPSGELGAEFPRILFVLRFWFRIGQERKSSYSQKDVVVTYGNEQAQRKPAAPTCPHVPQQPAHHLSC